MSRRVGVVSDAVVAGGFRLAGIEPEIADSPGEGARILERMMGERRWAVILVQEDLLQEVPSWAGRRTATGLPLVIPFPPPSRARLPGEAETYVAELLRRAVGYRVRLQ